MTEAQQPSLEQATSITMQAYARIAVSYAQRHTDAHRPTFWHEIHKRFVTLVQDSPAWQANCNLPVLDAGCGPARDALLFARQGFQVQAIDLSEAMLEQARLNLADKPEERRIALRQMDMRHLELTDASCAAVWVSASFLHIPKQENLTVLTELARVLVEQGPLALLVKADDGKPLERYDPDPVHGELRFFARYGGGELWELLEQAGLRVLFMASWDGTNETPWLGALAMKYAKK
jgi:ubiquinone/menaquinone biosynthesis C-methylase UbiE